MNRRDLIKSACALPIAGLMKLSPFPYLASMGDFFIIGETSNGRTWELVGPPHDQKLYFVDTDRNIIHEIYISRLGNV